jgi:myosin heavy subunit
MVYRSLTEQIYVELMDGIDKGLDWDELLKKYGGSKGPLYNAFAHTLPELRKRYEKLASEIMECKETSKEAKSSLEDEQRAIARLGQEIKDRQALLERLSEDEKKAEEKLNRRRREIKEKEELLSSLRKMDEMGFSSERLEQLAKLTRAMGARCKLSPSEAVNKFFQDLQLWDDKLGLQVEIERLAAEKDRVETQKSVREEEMATLEQRVRGKEAAIEALQELASRGVEKKRIILWDQILRLAGVRVETLKEELERWASLENACAAKEKRIKRLDEESTKMAARLKELETRRAEIEGAVKGAIEESVRLIKQAGEEARTSIRSAVTKAGEDLKALYDHALKAGERIGEMEKSLPSKAEAKSLLDFINNPSILPRDNAVLLRVVASLYAWVDYNEGKLSFTYTMKEGLKALRKELEREKWQV